MGECRLLGNTTLKVCGKRRFSSTCKNSSEVAKLERVSFIEGSVVWLKYVWAALRGRAPRFGVDVANNDGGWPRSSRAPSCTMGLLAQGRKNIRVEGGGLRPLVSTKGV